MLLSIFIKAKAHPKGKQEKAYNSQFCGKPHEPSIVEINTEDDLFDVITQYAWSPSIYCDTRSLKNFLFADFIAADIDDGMTLQEAEKLCEKANLTAMVAPSPSHTKEHHKFRIVVPLVKRITDLATFDATWKKLEEIFPALDQQCKDASRFYFACRTDTDDCFWYEGDMLEPAEVQINNLTYEQSRSRINTTVSSGDLENKDILTFLYGKVPRRISGAVAHFFENADSGLSGEWTCSLNSAVFALALLKIDEDKIWEAIDSVSPEPLDEKDEYQIKKAIRDGYGKSEL